ncbi:hypothetical protein FRC12_002477 [Ceratobasidium sp. 428]|nr:hypothetical protein FRC12_002477 [Ceratobasidium sp. 428]
MQFQAIVSRLAALALFFVSFSMLVHAAPTLDTRDIGTGPCSGGCNAGDQLVLTLKELKLGLTANVGNIGKSRHSTTYVVACTAAIQTAVADVIRIEQDTTDAINAKATEVAALLAVIINTTAQGLYAASGKITLQVFLGLVQQTDAALKALIVAVLNLIAAVVTFLGASVDAVKLAKVGLNACLNILGLN